MRKSFNLPSRAFLIPTSFIICLSGCLAIIRPAMSQTKAMPEDGAPLAPLTRVSNSPLLSPSVGPGFYQAGAFNPAATKENGRTILLFRAQDTKGVSSVGFASSQDGKLFKVDSEPVFAAQEIYELGGGVEDPRLQKIDGKFYLTYTAYNGKDAQLCLASSDDLRSWHRLGIIMPAYQGTWNKKWTKSGAIVPVRINNKYWMYYLGTVNDTDEMGLASSDDLIHWKDATEKPVLPKRDKMFDSRVVEPGPAPIITDRGILLIYNGADDKLVYRTGWVLFDKNDPTKVLARSSVPLFEPEQKWEKVGQVPNVVFVEGLVQHGNELLLYYGGADKYVGVAKTHLQ
jgi:predicted GH43/DUF377 family glycosyl hydrolase